MKNDWFSYIRAGIVRSISLKLALPSMIVNTCISINFDFSVSLSCLIGWSLCCRRQRSLNDLLRSKPLHIRRNLTAHGKLETLAVVLHEYCVIVGDILCHIVSFIFKPNQIVNANLHYDLCFKTVWYYRSSLVIVKVQHLFWNNWISSFNFLRPFDTAFIRIKMPRENSSVSV